jgi:hypothetical protein
VVGSVVLAIVPWVGLQKPPGRIGALFVAFACVAVLWAGGWAWVLLSRFRRIPAVVVAIVVVCRAVYVEGLFAVLYYALSVESPQAFNVPLTRIDTAYFTISTATTTGMGDIHPVSGAARLLVSGQMIASLFLIVIAITTAVQRVLARADHPPGKEPTS